MSEASKEFMIEEYKQIANAYQDLHAQHNELVKVYLALVAIPASALAVVAKIVDIQSLVGNIAIPIIFAFLLALCLIGVAILSALITTRCEAILYVRTVNCVRRYFVEHAKDVALKDYLVLPDYDFLPPFYESTKTRAFWNIVIVVILNCAIFFVSVYSLLSVLKVTIFKIESTPIYLSFAISVICFLLQYRWHHHLCAQHAKTYKVKFSTPYPHNIRIGLDLDGTIADLAKNVIRYAKTMFGIKIRLNQITSHNLEKCTNLSSEQLRQLFSNIEIFKTLRAIKGSKKAIRKINGRHYEIHIVSDRFWSKEDWKIAKGWLNAHKISYSYLNLVPSADKAEYAKTNNINHFVEDNLDTAISLSYVCDKVYLLDKPYNQGEIPQNVIRCNSWDDIASDLLRI